MKNIKIIIDLIQMIIAVLVSIFWIFNPDYIESDPYLHGLTTGFIYTTIVAFYFRYNNFK